ncbi:pyridine nucleotide-disulfide oxidoreductase [Paramyrothecium foliicola]|nr:pyridine nucleotide-disulfide oxidoreductase [Paramyrothecium foliicola]
MAHTVHVDYLVIGAGAMGMAFVDTLLTTTQKTVAIIDRYARPGGHWTVAYPYVRLHQASSFYGVSSKNLGQGGIDKVGWNKGLYELASRDEICAYYDTIMNQTFLPSGRVTYYPGHEYTGGKEFKSIMTAKVYHVGKDTRIVDATFMKVKVPSMGPPAYEVAKDIEVITPNHLPSAARPHIKYHVIGAGKTGIDACLWLLANDIDPAYITWIMPRDSFYLARDVFQSGEDFAESPTALFKGTLESSIAASSVEDLLNRLVACQQLLRLDDEVWPTMWRCATVSLAEFGQLKKIKNIVRQGRVIRIDRDEVILQHGSYKPELNSLFIDCTADGLAKQDPEPIFQSDRIRLQPVRYCQQVFSAAFIAHVEATYPDGETKNKLCRPIPHPNDIADLPLTQLQSALNDLYWGSYPQTKAWLAQCRLNIAFTTVSPLTEKSVAARGARNKLTEQVNAMCANLKLLIKDLPQGEAAAKFEALLK